MLMRKPGAQGALRINGKPPSIWSIVVNAWRRGRYDIVGSAEHLIHTDEQERERDERRTTAHTYIATTKNPHETEHTERIYDPDLPDIDTDATPKAPPCARACGGQGGVRAWFSAICCSNSSTESAHASTRTFMQRRRSADDESRNNPPALLSRHPRVYIDSSKPKNGILVDEALTPPRPRPSESRSPLCAVESRQCQSRPASSQVAGCSFCRP